MLRGTNDAQPAQLLERRFARGGPRDRLEEGLVELLNHRARLNDFTQLAVADVAHQLLGK